MSLDVTLSIPNESLLSSEKNVKKKSFLTKVANYFNEFSANTSIHGFKYLASNKGCVHEKIWWIFVLTVCVCACFKFLIVMLAKREDNPFFVSLHPTPMNMWDVPFPAITLCPANKIHQNKYNLTYYNHKYLRGRLNRSELKNFLDANFFCNNPKPRGSHLRILKHRVDQDSLNFFVKNAPSLEDILHVCSSEMEVEDYSCGEDFSPVFTNAGLCYTFNMLDRSEIFNNITYLPENHMKNSKTKNWSVDNNYVKTLNDTYPKRVTSITDYLFLTLKSSKFVVNKLCGKHREFKLILHHPAEVPTLSSRHISLLNDQSYKIWIKPELTTTSKKLKDYEPHKRGCYFSDERPLKYFKFYTESNCKLECVSNYTLHLCGCSSYNMPREENTKLCGLADEKCKDHAKDIFLRMDMALDIYDNDLPKNKQQKYFCGCLPSCTSIVYNEEITLNRKLSSGNQNFIYTQVYISFKYVTFLTIERNELFSDADFFASCGGLFSLFTGFSVVSLAEIIYFLTLKWMCNLWHFGKRFL